MSIQAYKAVVGAQELAGSTLLIALTVAMRCNNDHVCWPSVATIAADANCTRRTVTSSLKKLRDRGLIEFGRKRGKTRTIKVNVPALEMLAEHKRHLADSEPVFLRRRENLDGSRSRAHPADCAAEWKSVTDLASQISSKESGTINNPQGGCAASLSDEEIEEIDGFFFLLEERWKFAAEFRFIEAARKLIDPHTVAGWIRHGRPAFLIVADPLVEHDAASAAGLAISWAVNPPCRSELEPVMRWFGFADDALWSWATMMERFANAETLQVCPANVGRLRRLPAIGEAD